MTDINQKKKNQYLSDISLKYIRAMNKLSGFNLNEEVHDYVKDKLTESVTGVAVTKKGEQFVSRDPMHYELKIRQILKVTNDWQQIKQLSKKWFELCSKHGNGSNAASKNVEHAFLYGDAHQALKLAIDYFSYDSSFYVQIHSSIRSQILAQEWKSELWFKLVAQITRFKADGLLVAMEHLAIFVALARKQPSLIAYAYFKRHRKLLVSLYVTESNEMPISYSSLMLEAAGLARKLNYFTDCCQLVKEIKSTDSEYAKSRMLLEGADDFGRYLNKTPDYIKWQNQTNWQHKLKDFEQALKHIRGLAPESNLKDIEINMILKDPLKYFPKDVEVWKAISNVISQNLSIVEQLPNIDSLYFKHITKVLKAEYNAAIWQCFLKLEDRNQRAGIELYYKGICYLHSFLLKLDSSNEALLWKSRTFLEKYFAENKVHMDSKLYHWNYLVKWGVSVVRGHSTLSSDLKTTLIALFNITNSIKELSLCDVEDYLSRVELSNLDVIKHLSLYASHKGMQELEIRIISQGAFVSHYSNSELRKVWSLSAKRKQFDLAWRVASVRLARSCLDQRIERLWKISGEKRKSYQMLSLNQQVVEVCMTGFAKQHRRLIWSLLRVGKQLPALLAVKDKNLRLHRYQEVQSKCEAQIEQYLDKQSFLSKVKKDFSLQRGGGAVGCDAVPMFAQSLPEHTWSRLVGSISHRLGFNSWHWSLQYLDRSIESLKVGQSYRGHSLVGQGQALSKWLKRLSLEERQGWYDLLQVTKALSDGEVKDSLAIFICRLATYIYPDHYAALSCVRQMKLALPLIWGLESWILSEGYSDLRQHTGQLHLTPVSPSLITL